VLILKNIMKLSRLIAIGTVAFFSAQSFAQMPLSRITQLEEESINISLDGFVEEAAWQSLPVIDGMKVMDPDTLEDVPYKTEIRFFFYGERALYWYRKSPTRKVPG